MGRHLTKLRHLVGNSGGLNLRSGEIRERTVITETTTQHRVNLAPGWIEVFCSSASHQRTGINKKEENENSRT